MVETTLLYYTDHTVLLQRTVTMHIPVMPKSQNTYFTHSLIPSGQDRVIHKCISTDYTVSGASWSYTEWETCVNSSFNMQNQSEEKIL